MVTGMNGELNGVNGGRRNGNGRAHAEPPVTITGGAGFIGISLANRLLDEGQPVRIFDDLSGPVAEDNLEWLRSRHRRNLQYVKGDVRDPVVLQAAINGSSFVFHLAARRPADDDDEIEHEVNSLGTLRVLEAVRKAKNAPGLVFASSRDVYGCMADVRLRHVACRCEPEDEAIRRHGIDEQRPLGESCSAYGLSKAMAERCVLDYCRKFDLTAVVLRMSCIYGPHQQPGRDHGWVGHLLRTALRGDELTVFGDGRQVRDLLYVDDLVAAMLAARDRAGQLSGQAYNIGGGPRNTMSVREMIRTAARLNRRPMEVVFAEKESHDPSYFVADHRRFTAVTGWRPETSIVEGVEQLWAWLLATGASPRHAFLLSRERRAGARATPRATIRQPGSTGR